MVCRWVPVCWGLGWVGLLHRPEDRAEGGQPRQQWPLRRSDQGGRDIHFYVDCQYFQLFPSFIDRGSCWFCWCSGLYSANGCCYGTNCYCCFGLHYQLLLFWPLFSTAVAVLSSITNCCRFDLYFQLQLLFWPPLPTADVFFTSITNCCCYFGLHYQLLLYSMCMTSVPAPARVGSWCSSGTTSPTFPSSPATLRSSR